eukprot:NODE_57_length_28844_cov_0.352687.p21 type:complete len:154 gc:universal NODE_57_length_28844_cov_0.352687:209-670(+)
MAKKKVREEEETYEVENIVDHKNDKGKVVYLVKWKGYDSGDNTWEYEKNLSGCPELLKEYKKVANIGQEKQKSVSKSSPKKRKSAASNASPKKRKSTSRSKFTDDDVLMISNMDRLENGEIECLIIFKDTNDEVALPLSVVRFNAPQKYFKFI